MRGQAGWGLVETYDAERRAVAQRITSQSLQNSMHVLKIFAAAAAGDAARLRTDQALVAARRYGNHLGVELGAAYDSPAVVGDGSAPPAVEDSHSDYRPSATPGCRAPHVWLGHPEARLSTLDLFGPSFTLLAASPADGWRAAAAEVSAALGLPITSYDIGAPGLQDRGAFAAAYGLDPDGAVLVRPDGHVAWRSIHGPATSAARRAALTQIAARA